MLDTLLPVLVFLLSTVAYVQVRYRRHRPDAPEVLTMEDGDVVRDVWRLKQPFALPPERASLAAVPHEASDGPSVTVDCATSATVPSVAGASLGADMASERRLARGVRIGPDLAPPLCTPSHLLVQTGDGGAWGTWLCTCDRTYVVLHEGSCSLELMSPSLVRDVSDLRMSDGGTGLWIGDAVEPTVAVSLECGGAPHAIPAGWGFRVRGAGLTEVAFFGTLMSRLAAVPEYLRAAIGGVSPPHDEQQEAEELKAAQPVEQG
jgi:hypothetical protein